MAEARPNANNRQCELLEALVESLLAEVLVLEYRAKTQEEVDEKAAAVKSPTGIPRGPFARGTTRQRHNGLGRAARDRGAS